MSYIANTDKQRDEMLKACGVTAMEDLFSEIPQKLRPASFSLPEGKSEPKGLAHEVPIPKTQADLGVGGNNNLGSGDLPKP